MSTEKYELLSKDNKVVVCSVQALHHSETLSALTLNLAYTPDMDPIPVNNVDESTLQKVVKWMEHHKEEPRVEEKNRPAEQIVIGEWDEKFLSALSKEQMFDLICAANFLDVQGLMEVACKKVAEWIKGNCPQEMRDNWDRNLQSPSMLPRFQ